MTRNGLIATLKTSDAQTGLIFLAIGIAAAVGSLQYQVGSPARMGPGFFPLVLGVLLCLVGAISLWHGLKSTDVIDEVIAWRPLIFITLAIAVSAALLLTAGLLVAIPALVIISAFASAEIRWVQVAVTAVLLTALAYGVFIWGLNMRIPLFW